ncbi:MAG: glycosyltransferase family 2 protein [Planctomycetaceae bacterium]
MSVPRITVFVVGYNSEKWLERCLSTLQTASASTLQLCFVDNHNNPTLDSRNVSKFDVEIVKTPRPMGFADANNFGIGQTRFESDLTVFLNQDTISSDGWIDACADCFASDSSLGILSPGLRTYDMDDWEPNLLTCLADSGKSTVSEASEAGVVAVRQVTAAAMIVRTEILDQLGPFDPIFGSYYEDYDLCRRIRNAGHTIGVCLGARVGHFSGSVTSTPEQSRRRMRSLIRNRLIHKVRESGDRRLRVLAVHFAMTLPKNLIRGLLRTKSSQPLITTVAAHWDLLKIARRLVSKRRDESDWRQFLQDCGTTTESRSS